MQSIVEQFDGSRLQRCPHAHALLFERKQCAAKFFHCILQFHIGLCCTVGCGFNIVACIGHLLADDFAHGFGHVAGVLHLFLDFIGRQSEVVEDHQRLTPETCHDAVHHVVHALPGVLCLLLCKGEHGAQFIDGQFKVVELHGGLHQFQVGDGAVGGFAQSVEDVATSQTLKGVADAFALACKFYTLLHGLP